MNERELQIYSKVGNFHGLKQAKQMIEQDQIDRFIPGKGRERVRKEVSDKGTEYTAIIKAFIQNEGQAITNRLEETVVVTEDFFRLFGVLGGQRIKKQRYIFFSGPIAIQKAGEETSTEFPPVKIEVDVPIRPDGATPTYVKIDVEVQELLEQIENKLGASVSKVDIDFQIDGLAFVPQEAFVADSSMTDEQKAIVDNFWKDNAWPMLGEAAVKPKPSVAASDNTNTNNSEETDEPEGTQRTSGANA